MCAKPGTTQHDPDALSDAQWARLALLMPGGCEGKRGPRTDNRLFLDELLWMTRGDGRSKDRPETFGKVGTVKRRYYDWMARGVLAEGMARGGRPLRKDCRQLHRRPLPRRSPRSDHVTTDPRTGSRAAVAPVAPLG